jgi:hypothetical protein
VNPTCCQEPLGEDGAKSGDEIQIITRRGGRDVSGALTSASSPKLAGDPVGVSV